MRVRTAAATLLLVATTVATAAASTPAPTASPVDDAAPTASPFPETVPSLRWEVVSRRPHDTAAFTQGLVLDASGRLFESTGLFGSSSVREVDPSSGAVLRSRSQPADQFGEGLALVGDELIQLTWQAGVARRFEADTFEVLRRHRYAGEGWGLCYDGTRLVMSDGSADLTFRDPETFEAQGSVTVTVFGQHLPRLNELECVGDAVWANVWKTNLMVRIDPHDGAVTGVLDLSGIIEPHPVLSDSGAVLNGIAYDAEADSFLVTGTLWPELIEIRLLD